MRTPNNNLAKQNSVKSKYGEKKLFENQWPLRKKTKLCDKIIKKDDSRTD